MQRRFGPGLILIGLGVYTIVDGAVKLGIFLVLLGALDIAIYARRRNSPAIDPVLQAHLDAAWELKKKDPTAAQVLLDKAFADSERREEAELNTLRQRAATDRKAAIELRNRLRRKLESEQSLRRRAENPALNPPHRAALLERLERAASQTEQELAQTEQYLEQRRE